MHNGAVPYKENEMSTEDSGKKEEQAKKDAEAKTEAERKAEAARKLDAMDPEERAKAERKAEVEQAVKEALADLKGKLDSSYAARDEALKKVAEFEAKQREEELKRLEEAGKHKEAYELREATMKAELDILKKRNVELSRDQVLRAELAQLDFRSKRTQDIAFGEIIPQLIQDADGKWVHRSGKDIGDFLADYAADEELAFLFKPKASSGTGTSSSGSTTSTGGSDKTSVFKMSQAEVLKRAAAGKLPQRR